jgi:putative thioredoxin
VLEAALAADPADLRARHLLGVSLLLEGAEAQGLEQFLEMLRRDRAYGDQLAKRSLIDAFRIIEDPELVGAYRRRMASLLF